MRPISARRAARSRASLNYLAALFWAGGTISRTRHSTPPAVTPSPIVVGTGVAWGKIRSFEFGINHIFSDALGGGGEDGAIDILLVGMDSRTDAHGNALSEEELATLRAGDDEATNTDTIILVRIPNNGKSATAISIPRDSYVAAPGIGKMKIWRIAADRYRNPPRRHTVMMKNVAGLHNRMYG